MEPDVKIKNIVLQRLDRCTVCHRDFSTDDIHVISRKPDIWTMLVECEDCHSRNFVAAVLNDGDPDEAHLALRRLTQDALEPAQLEESTEPPIELEGPSEGDPISAGDVVDVHQFLQTFDGDFRKLFRDS